MYPSTLLPWFTRDEITGQYVDGFLVDFLRQMRQFEPDLVFELTPVYNSSYYDDITGMTLRMLDQGEIDIGWDNNLKISQGYLYTQSMFESHLVILTKKTRISVSKWQVFAPFETELWCLILGSILFGSLSLSLMTMLYSDQTIHGCFKAFPGFFYHTWAAVLGGDEYDLYHFPPMGRLYRLGLLWLVMVVTATYTANLAAFLTRPNFMVHPPKTLEELQTSTVCNRWPGYADQVAIFAGTVVNAPVSYGPEERNVWARDMLQRGECDAIMEIKAHLKKESLQFCDTMYLNPDINLAPTPLFFILPLHETELARRLSQAVLKTQRLKSFPTLVANYMQYDLSCPNANLNNNNDDQQIKFEQVMVTFAVFGACSFFTIAFTAVQRLKNKGKALGDPKHEVQNEKLDGKLDTVMEELLVVKKLLGLHRVAV